MQSPSGRILIYLAQSPQRAQRRFVDCCGQECPPMRYALPTLLHSSDFTLSTSYVSHRAHRGRRDSHYFKLSISRFRLYMARCTEIPRYGCRGNRHGMTLECEDTEHRPHRHCMAPTAQCNLRVVAQIPMPFVSRSGRSGILLIAVRRRMSTTLHTSDFTSRFRLHSSYFLHRYPLMIK